MKYLGLIAEDNERAREAAEGGQPRSPMRRLHDEISKRLKGGR